MPAYSHLLIHLREVLVTFFRRSFCVPDLGALPGFGHSFSVLPSLVDRHAAPSGALLPGGGLAVPPFFVSMLFPALRPDSGGATYVSSSSRSTRSRCTSEDSQLRTCRHVSGGPHGSVAGKGVAGVRRPNSAGPTLGTGRLEPSRACSGEVIHTPASPGLATKLAGMSSTDYRCADPPAW